MNLVRHFSVDLDSTIGQCRAVPVRYSKDQPEGFLTLTCRDFDVDPFVEMFFFPTDTLKMTLIAADGSLVWQRDLGPAVVPGMWFCPAFPFDLDGDGIEEIWFVNNTDPSHPLAASRYCLERVDSATGEATGQWPWYARSNQRLSHAFRNFILGGYVNGAPVLVTAQGTYEAMYLQAWKPGMTSAWELEIAAESPGARGSHMCPVVDINSDGTDELLWGERCISLSDGRELFCADRETYSGHSDVVQPVYDWEAGTWSIYTCRESDVASSPRVALYDASGERIWGVLDHGHIDMGWVATVDSSGRRVAMATRIGKKSCGPDGREYQDLEQFYFRLDTGTPDEVSLDSYKTIPVDLNGDGIHEFVRGAPGGSGEVINLRGERLGAVPGAVALASKLLPNFAGEQVLVYSETGAVSLWYDAEAEDSAAARRRYGHPFYRASRKLTSTGSNLVLPGGL